MESHDRKEDNSSFRQTHSRSLIVICFVLFFFNILSISAQSDYENSEEENKRTEEYLKSIIEESKSKALKSQSRFEDIEIDQIIVNDMITKAGDDFFDHFTSDFAWPETDQNFIISISERPFFASSTLINIKVNDLDVFQNILQPRSSYLEDLADYAQALTVNFITNYQQIMYDLEGEDRSGTGIY